MISNISHKYQATGTYGHLIHALGVKNIEASGSKLKVFHEAIPDQRSEHDHTERFAPSKYLEAVFEEERHGYEYID